MSENSKSEKTPNSKNPETKDISNLNSIQSNLSSKDKIQKAENEKLIYNE